MRKESSASANIMDKAEIVQSNVLNEGMKWVLFVRTQHFKLFISSQLVSQ